MCGLQELDLQDIACIKGWVKTDLPQEPLALSPPPPMRPILNAPPQSVETFLDTQPDVPELPPVEGLPDNYDNFHISPRAALAIPTLTVSSSAEDDWYDEFDEVEPQQAVEAAAESQGSVLNSDDSAIAQLNGSADEPEGSRDSESDDEDLLTTLFYSDSPEHLCR